MPRSRCRDRRWVPALSHNARGDIANDTAKCQSRQQDVDLAEYRLGGFPREFAGSPVRPARRDENVGLNHAAMGIIGRARTRDDRGKQHAAVLPPVATDDADDLGSGYGGYGGWWLTSGGRFGLVVVELLGVDALLVLGLFQIPQLHASNIDTGNAS